MVSMRELIDIVVEAPPPVKPPPAPKPTPKALPVAPVPAKAPTPPVPAKAPTLPVPAKVAPAQTPPVPAKVAPTVDASDAGRVGQSDIDARTAAHLSDLEAIHMPNSFTGQIRGERDAKIVQFDSPAKREIQAKLASGVKGIDTTGMTPQQIQQMRADARAAGKEFLRKPEPLTPEEQAELEKFAK